MNAIHRIGLIPSRSHAFVLLALPRLAPRSLALTIGVRRWLAIGFAVIGASAAAAYIVAVNAILLSGAATQRQNTLITALQRERTEFENILIARQSPAWLQARAAGNGMVAVSGLRYLTLGEPPVALSR